MRKKGIQAVLERSASALLAVMMLMSSSNVRTFAESPDPEPVTVETEDLSEEETAVEEPASQEEINEESPEESEEPPAEEPVPEESEKVTSDARMKTIHSVIANGRSRRRNLGAVKTNNSFKPSAGMLEAASRGY